jgi:hypothetical protein
MPELPPEELIAGRLAGELESAGEAGAGARPGFACLFGGGTVIMTDLSGKWPALRQVARELSRQVPAWAVIASRAAVAGRLRERWAEPAAECAGSMDGERAEEPGLRRWRAGLGHELPEGLPDPDHPVVIYRELPPEHREAFERDYARAWRQAADPGNFGALERTLRLWRARADACCDPALQAGQERSLRAIQTGDLSGYVTLDEATRRQGPVTALPGREALAGQRSFPWVQ